MSYALIDHAAWVQDRCRAIVRKWNSRKHASPPPIPLPPRTLNEFQRKVCDILGMAGGGTHSPINWDRAIWEYGDGQTSFACVWQGEMSTWEFSQLTLLVFLCHEARIKLTMTGTGPHLMRLAFHERSDATTMAEGHPSLVQAVRWFRDVYLPKDHRIIYRSKSK